MKFSLRSLFFLLVVPLAIGLGIVLVMALVPLFSAQTDLRKIDQELAYTLAAREFAASSVRLTREYAELLIIGPDEEDDVREAAAASQRTLETWRNLASPTELDELRTVQQVTADQAVIVRAGEQLIRLARENRHAEAAQILIKEVHPRAVAVAEAIDRTRGEHQRAIAAHVWRMDGGIDYSRVLKFGGLQDGIDDLDSHVSEVLEAGAFQAAAEREITAYWYSFLSNDPRLAGDISRDHARAADALAAWRHAVQNVGGSNAFGGLKRREELRFLADVHRHYEQVISRAAEASRLGAGGSAEERRRLLLPTEFERTPVAAMLDKYMHHDLEVALTNLSYLRSEALRVRLTLMPLAFLPLLIALVATLFVSRKVIGPLSSLQRAAERIGLGDLDVHVRVSAILELNKLADTFNHMAADLKRSRESLHKSEERFKLVTLATSDKIWDWDFRTSTGWVNEEYRSCFGDEVKSLPEWIEAIHPDDRSHFIAGMEAMDHSGENFWADAVRARTRTGSYIDVFDRGYIVRDDDGRPVRMIGAITDVTQLKAAERAIAALSHQKEMILNSVGDGILGIDQDGTIISANPAATRILGYEPAELQGHNVLDIVPGELLDRRERAGDVPDRLSFHRSDGTSFQAEYTNSPLTDEDGSVIGAVITFRDVTQRHEVEQLKSQFVSTVSHELRTPLTAIRGALGLLSSGRVGPMPAKGQRMLEIATSNSDRLSRLINDILDVERLDSGHFTLLKRPLEVEHLLRQALETMKPLADKSDIAVRIEPFAGMISADHDRMMQLFTNLLGNAVKFSSPGTTIVLGAEREDAMVRFRVSDQGRGIPEDKREAIFERFQQVDASDSRDKGGTGLGLAICRMIVQQHGGRIWVESVLGEGSTFCFTIPLAEEDSSAAEPGAGPFAGSDDVSAVQRALQNIIASDTPAVL